MIITKQTLPQIWYGFHQTPFGTCLIGRTDKAVCHLSFPENNSLDALKKQWPEALLIHDQKQTKLLIEQIFTEHTKPNLVLKGTDFQIKVWKQLLEIPYGTTTHYQDIANRIGKPQAHRAVATAIARNSIAYLIPCHRVVHKSGSLSNYRWGISRKQALINFETQ